MFTAEQDSAPVEAVAVAAGRIVYVGAEDGIGAWIGERTEVVEIGPGMLLPGFTDSHVHPVSGGIELGECDLNEAGSRREVLALITDCASRNPSASWVRGGGYQLPIFDGGAPTRQLLDSIIPNRPAYFSSADGHSAWVNSRALEIAGVSSGTPDPPPDGVIVRDSGGMPAGTLRESAMSLVSRHLPPHGAEEIRAGLARALSMASAFGITALHEASANEPFLRAYAEPPGGPLPLRVLAALRVDPSRGTAQVPELVALGRRYTGGSLDARAAKIFLDGVIEGSTGALLEPYADNPSWSGALNFDPDTLDALVRQLDEAGFKVHIHAIGDRAIRVGLDAFEAQARRDRGEGPRHVMAHIQLFDTDDIGRFAELGVVASFQPLWFYADTYITDLTEPRLGPERSRWLYPARSVLESEALVAFGSDWSVSSMNPLLGIEVAVTRRDPALDEGPAWLPEQKLTLEQALRAYTLGGAYAADLELETGSIRVGKSADLVVLDTDLFAVAPERISEASVRMTVFEGRIVHRR